MYYRICILIVLFFLSIDLVQGEGKAILFRQHSQKQDYDRKSYILSSEDRELLAKLRTEKRPESPTKKRLPLNKQYEYETFKQESFTHTLAANLADRSARIGNANHQQKEHAFVLGDAHRTRVNVYDRKAQALVRNAIKPSPAE